MTAILLPCVCVNMWFKRVVLPDPRKPVSTDTGILLAADSARAAMVLAVRECGGSWERFRWSAACAACDQKFGGKKDTRRSNRKRQGYITA